ncbi:MAG: prepilin-type N-terminal cleavage/methylation domain-containing protein [Planctomycetota bacterium]
MTFRRRKQTGLGDRVGRRASRPRARRSDGYTLLELLLTVAVLAALSAVLWPAVSAWQEGARLARAADDLRGLLTGLRVRAMEEGKQYVFSFQSGTGNYRVALLTTDPNAPKVNLASDPTTPPGRATFDAANLIGEHALEEKIAFASPAPQNAVQAIGQQFQVASANAQGQNWSAVEFHPDGTTADAEFLLVDDADMAVTLRLRGLTGTVQVSRPMAAASMNGTAVSASSTGNGGTPR